MGVERSADRLRHPLPTVQIAAHRVSPIDPKVYHSVARQRSFRAEDFPQRILLPGLPFYLGEGWRSIAPTRRLGDFFLGVISCAGVSRKRLQFGSQSSHGAKTIPLRRYFLDEMAFRSPALGHAFRRRAVLSLLYLRTAWA